MTISYFKDSPTGLYVNLTTFLGLGQDHVQHYYQLTNNPVFLHIKRTKKEVSHLYPYKVLLAEGRSIWK